jgi:hypothetical protein
MNDRPIRTSADYAEIELGFEATLRDRVESMVTDALASGTDRAGLAALTANVTGYLEAAMAELRRYNPPPTPLACRAGCDHCCHNPITTTPLQVLAIAETLRDDLGEAALAALRRRLDQVLAAQSAEGWTAWALRRPRCPLLQDGGCIAYSVRPFGCRGWTSLDRAACAADLARDGLEAVSVPFYLPQAKIATSIQAGVEAGLGHAGYPADPVELAAGLALALATLDASARWLAGEPIFEAAHPPSTGA